MKKILTAIAATFIISLNGQTTFNPRTGDVEMDAHLKSINVKAQTDLPAFKNEVSVGFQIPKPKIEILLQTMAPAEVYMAAEIANIIGKPVEIVVNTYTTNKNKGWGEIAKDLGIKPGSKEFHEMKARFKNKGNKGNMKGQGKSGSKEKGKGKGKK
ncbi:MAG: hypothetical protein V4565_03965 [Bacteroidota bacterium]